MSKNPLVGLVGWRGMVGSVLLERMTAERDFEFIEPLFFSTSNAGGAAPAQAGGKYSNFLNTTLNFLSGVSAFGDKVVGQYQAVTAPPPPPPVTPEDKSTKTTLIALGVGFAVLVGVLVVLVIRNRNKNN